MSLHRLGSEHADLYQRHRVDPEVPIEESWGTLAETGADVELSAADLAERTRSPSRHGGRHRRPGRGTVARRAAGPDRAGPGRALGRPVGVDDVPDGYRAMADREALKVLVQL
ncbi:aldo/keto reductase [Streptomyces sp. NPDC050433]|uniref:aldo/keto reductase n=1 Tax=Streptomyces sp. NPDC050433 TaxID=3365615 RepID=UPI0037995087